MNRHLNFVTLICLITGFVSLASCSNDDDEMDKYQKIYIRTGVAPGAEMGCCGSGGLCEQFLYCRTVLILKYNCVPYSRLRGMSLPLWE